MKMDLKIPHFYPFFTHFLPFFRTDFIENSSKFPTFYQISKKSKNLKFTAILDEIDLKNAQKSLKKALFLAFYRAIFIENSRKSPNFFLTLFIT